MDFSNRTMYSKLEMNVIRLRHISVNGRPKISVHVNYMRHMRDLCVSLVLWQIQSVNSIQHCYIMKRIYGCFQTCQ